MTITQFITKLSCVSQRQGTFITLPKSLCKNTHQVLQYESEVLRVGVAVGALGLLQIGHEFDPPVAPLSCNIGQLSFACRLGKGGNVTSAGWQATVCDPLW